MRCIVCITKCVASPVRQLATRKQYRRKTIVKQHTDTHLSSLNSRLSSLFSFVFVYICVCVHLFGWLLPSIPRWIKKVDEKEGEEQKNGWKKSCGCVLMVKWYFPLQRILQNSWKTYKQSASGRSTLGPPMPMLARSTESYNRSIAWVGFFAFRHALSMFSPIFLTGILLFFPVLFFPFPSCCVAQAHNMLSLAFGDFRYFFSLCVLWLHCTDTHIYTFPTFSRGICFSFYCNYIRESKLYEITATAYLFNINDNNNFNNSEN